MRSYSVLVKHTFKGADAEKAAAQARTFIPKRAKIVSVECEEQPDPATLPLSPYTLKFLDSEEEFVQDEANTTLDYCAGTLEQIPDDVLAEQCGLAAHNPAGLSNAGLALLVQKEVGALVRLLGGDYRVGLVLHACGEGLRQAKDSLDE